MWTCAVCSSRILAQFHPLMAPPTSAPSFLKWLPWSHVVMWWWKKLYASSCHSSMGMKRRVSGGDWGGDCGNDCGGDYDNDFDEDCSVRG